ncbi:hypothetical protein BAUCODRAFT_37942 [Baudoinia panamericana UAMH 10762]|uniref:Sodium/calcium exchanger membrane region domain-containing protein n=1 Tax=Baudoinia panamericana (strain UAMH 10762) TaxID=717646 RepID=M2N221_BAUPA|nr:uncharacterized protein BAUCODRAFT_37942 [Baudoinia panamericana UAMH 10762]EMC93014.1 hypothetical protein BAUCODRAFT_37942 [Baudoinia panamericana UAMH 10762]
MSEKSTHNDTEDATSKSVPPPAPPPHTAPSSSGDSAIKPTKGEVTLAKKEKPTIGKYMLGRIKRFYMHTKNAIFSSWVNVLLIFVPLGIAMDAAKLNPALVFSMNAIAIIPLAGLLSHATEAVAARMGDSLGALLNVTFGNAVELIIFIIALVKNEINIVQASLIGSMLSNLLLILGMCFLLGGLRYREQIYNSTVTQMSACMLSISVMSLLLPTAFHASFSDASTAQADRAVLRVSRGTSVILLLVYILYLVFQLKSHAYMYESTPQEIIDEESHPGVLADIMNSSSSSSDDSSSTGDSDTDTSGSIMTNGRKIRKKLFRSRRRRKSNASASSTTQSVPSALSSPLTEERQGSYWESQVGSRAPSRRESMLHVIASADEGDADQEDGRHNIMPRIRDFVQNGESVNQGDESKVVEKKKSKRKQHRRHRKRHRRSDAEKEAAEQQQEKEAAAIEAEKDKSESAAQGPVDQPKVGFADDVEFVQNNNETRDAVPDPATAGRVAFNMRQLSSRVSYRPGLPKMLSNTVFTQPPPRPEPRAGNPALVRPVGAATIASRPAKPTTTTRTRSDSHGLRRTNSLPDRLNHRPQVERTATPTHVTHTDPLPPFQHQRQRQDIRAANPSDTPGSDSDEDEHEVTLSRTAAVVMLLLSTALVAVCAEFMVSAIPGMLASTSSVSEAFIGLIILPIVSNAAEHVTAVTVAMKNKMDLAIGVAIGSSIQIAIFVTPLVVLLGWILRTEMSLYFNLFETISLFVTAFVVNFLILDGRSNYMEGSLLIAAYVVIAVGAFYYPGSDAQSAVGGAGTS